MQTGRTTSKGIYIIRFIYCLFLFISSLQVLKAQQNYVIKKITFTGNEQVTKSELLQKISSAESNFISKYILKKEPSFYSEEFAQIDAEYIKALYQSQGYLNVKVKLDSVQKNDEKKTVNLFYHITENEPYRVKNVIYKLNNKEVKIASDSLIRSARNFLLIRKGTRFIDNKLLFDVDKITSTLHNKGYVYAETDYQLKLYPDSNLTDVIYNIKTDKKCSIGEIRIEGNNYVKNKYITNLQTFNTGDAYRNKPFDRMRKNLYNLELFRVVSIIPEKNTQTRINPIPIRIFLQEMPRWSTKFNVGWGTEDKMRVSGDFTFRSLFGSSRRLNLVVKHSAINPYYASLMWIEPHFFINNLSFIVNPYIKKDIEPGYTSQVYGVNFPISYKINSKLTSSFSYYLERVKQDVDSTDVDIANPENDKFQYNKSGIWAKTSFSNAEPKESPTKGVSISVAAKLNGYLLGSDFNYTRIMGDIRLYQKWGKFTFAERLMMGTVQSSDSAEFIPVEDRFYSGGMNSNRGWGRWQIGPKRSNGTPLGGKSILETNFEVRHPVFWRIEIAGFIDASNVWHNDAVYRFGDLNVAVGGGLRINTPIGPLRFDVGCPVWNEKTKVQFNVSVGQAF